MPNWVRNAGKVMFGGDSITVGYDGLTGGWRKPLVNALIAAGVKFQTVGPYTSDSPGMGATANHLGLSGDRAEYATVFFSGEVAARDPFIIVYGWGMNDLGNGRTPTQYLNDLDTMIDGAQANGFAIHLIQTLILPTALDPTYYAQIANYQTAQSLLPARVAAQGCKLVDVGTPTLADGVHPADGASGYDLMAASILAAILSSIP